jgi:hypothetical protein
MLFASDISIILLRHNETIRSYDACYNVYNCGVLPVPSKEVLMRRLARTNTIFISPQQAMLSTEKAIISNMALTYRGSSPAEKKYGLLFLLSAYTQAHRHYSNHVPTTYHMLPAWPRTLIIAVAQALFSGVWLVVLAPQANTRLLPVKQPAMYRKLAKYLAGTLRVATEMINPVTATLIEMMMCQPRSPSRSLLYAIAKVMRAPTR